MITRAVTRSFCHDVVFFGEFWQSVQFSLNISHGNSGDCHQIIERRLKLMERSSKSGCNVRFQSRNAKNNLVDFKCGIFWICQPSQLDIIALLLRLLFPQCSSVICIPMWQCAVYCCSVWRSAVCCNAGDFEKQAPDVDIPPLVSTPQSTPSGVTHY